jgi:hypothetical protein
MKADNTDRQTATPAQEPLREVPELLVEDHVKITDPESGKIIVNTRG